MRIRVIDLESTGNFPDHGVVEIGWCDLLSTQTDLALEPCGWQVGLPKAVLVNPGMPISPETSAVHHIIDEDVIGAPHADDYFTLVLTQPYEILAAHSTKFERMFISDEMAEKRPWIDTYKCALRIFPDAPSHSNQGLRYWLKPNGLDRATAMPAHRAGPDAYASAFLLRELLQHATVQQLIEWSDQPALQTKCYIGNWRGHKWSEVDTSFLHWILGKDFDEDVKFTVNYELGRREMMIDAEQDHLAEGGEPNGGE